MKRIVFLCVLTAIRLNAQDAQIYQKGSNGYVLSVPYTRTEDQEPKIADDKKQDDRKDTPAQENKETQPQQEPQSQETEEFTSGNAIVLQDEELSEQEESLLKEEEESALAVQEPEVQEEPEQMPMVEEDIYPEDEPVQETSEETEAQEEVIAEEESEQMPMVEEDIYPEDEPVQETSEETEAQEEVIAEEEPEQMSIVEEAIYPEDEAELDETAWQEEEEEEAEAQIEEEPEMEPEPVIQEPKPLRQEAVEIGNNKTVKTATVEEIKNNTNHYTDVILEGQLTLQLSDREFILTDSTGTLKVELTREAEYFLGNTLLIGSTVRVLGVVKRKIWNDVAVEGIKARVIIPSEVPLNGKSTAAQSQPVQNQDEADDMSDDQENTAYDEVIEPQEEF